MAFCSAVPLRAGRVVGSVLQATPSACFQPAEPAPVSSVSSRRSTFFAGEIDVGVHVDARSTADSSPATRRFVVRSQAATVVPPTSAVVLKPAPKIAKTGLQTDTASAKPEVETGGDGAKSKERENEEEFMGKWKVLLHNDEANTMEYVIKAIRTVVPNISHQEAVNIMLEAHTTGVGVVIVCEKEHAEYYCEGLKGYQLWSSIEPEDV
eukprot:tig00000241_g20990.t1